MKFDKIEKYYNELLDDIYGQPDEDGRTEISRSVIQSAPIGDIESVLDLGCGCGYAKDLFPEHVYYEGLTMSEAEVLKAHELGRETVYLRDFNLIEYEKRFDLIFSSHSLEHSPFPVLTLMVWHENASKLLLVVPNPEHYGYIGKNHYSVATAQQVRYWLRRAGWEVIWNSETSTDLVFLCLNRERIGEEGWAKELTSEIYEKDRDNKV